MPYSAQGGAARPATTPDSGIRVMLVDDSAVVRGLVARWLDEEAGISVVASLANGRRAVDEVAIHKPDVIVLDVEMPVLDGLGALPMLLERCPKARIIMASTLTRRNAEVSLKALSLGSSDYIPKPEGNRGVTTSTDFRAELVRKIRALAGARASSFGARAQSFQAQAPATTQPAARSTAASAQPTSIPRPASMGEPFTTRPFSTVLPRVLAIGSSTGGPQALVAVFQAITGAVQNVPVLVTQHMPPTFTTILAEHLARASGRVAREGEDGEILRPGQIYVAPGGKHMVLRDGPGPQIRLDDGPAINFCKPAVDPMFEAVARHYGAASLAVVLTGMGNDGAAGGRIIADAGGSVIAQDEATSVVWGMPGATARAGVCSAVLPLDQIGPKLVQILKGGVR